MAGLLATRRTISQEGEEDNLEHVRFSLYSSYGVFQAGQSMCRVVGAGMLLQYGVVATLHGYLFRVPSGGCV